MTKHRMPLNKLSIALMTTLALPGTAMGAAMTLQSDYLYIGANDYGTLGYYRNTSPGIQHDPTGTGTFDSTKDYFTPGTPFEGFSIYDNGGVVVNNNNSDVGGSAAAPTNATSGALAGTVLNKSGVAHPGAAKRRRSELPCSEPERLKIKRLSVTIPMARISRGGPRA